MEAAGADDDDDYTLVCLWSAEWPQGGGGGGEVIKRAVKKISSLFLFSFCGGGDGPRRGRAKKAGMEIGFLAIEHGT